MGNRLRRDEISGRGCGGGSTGRNSGFVTRQGFLPLPKKETGRRSQLHGSHRTARPVVLTTWSRVRLLRVVPTGLAAPASARGASLSFLPAADTVSARAIRAIHSTGLQSCRSLKV